MYINQIDNIIDSILDNLYLQIINDTVFNIMINEEKKNFVENHENINNFLESYINNVDTTQLKKLINNQENLGKLLSIIKRYVAYYYFLILAFYYTGTIKDFRNNIIQYSKLQEKSHYIINNFFDTENNYQLIKFFKIIKDTSKIIMMTDIQKKTLNLVENKDAINFLNNLGSEYIDNYLLSFYQNDQGEPMVEINVHNLIKTIVFGEIYKNQEQNIVFKMVNDASENEYEYTFIDIIVSIDNTVNLDDFIQIFSDDPKKHFIANELYLYANSKVLGTEIMTIDNKNIELLQCKMLTPIVDNFLRYHKDTEKIIGTTNIEPLTNIDNIKNVKLALQYQQKKKKENTKAQLVTNKIDTISNFYSESLKKNPLAFEEVKNYFQNTFTYRKAVLHNYEEEVFIVKKYILQGKKVTENNIYFLEMKHIIDTAYFNFKDFKKYGTFINVQTNMPINSIRYSNIEYQSINPNLELDIYTFGDDSYIPLVGFTIGPFNSENLMCKRKNELIDIRSITIKYEKKKNIISQSSDNGFKKILKIIKYFFVDNIKLSTEENIKFFFDFTNIGKLNPEIMDKVLYWEYDIDKDVYVINTYENIGSNNFQEYIRLMNSIIYDKLNKYLKKKLIKIIREYSSFSYHCIYKIMEIFITTYNLKIDPVDKSDILIKEYLQKNDKERKPKQEISIKNLKLPTFILIPDLSIFRIYIDTINPLNPRTYYTLKSISNKPTNNLTNIEKKCYHENEWNEILKYEKTNLTLFNVKVSAFIEKFAKQAINFDFVCQVCGKILPIKQFLQDGSFDNNTQKFITAYTPSDIPLEQLKDYSSYGLIIKYLDTLMHKISFIIGVNIIATSSTENKQKKMTITKNIVDLLVKHNTINLQKNRDKNERLDYFSKKFNINKDMDNIYFFKPSDSVLNLKNNISSIDAEINKLKINNILLYFMLVFITELNGTQILMMTTDKIANINTYLKYGPKIFGNLLIKKNTNTMDTIQITQYPVLCYILFMISYYFIKYKIWYYPALNTNTFNPIYQKIIVNTFVDLFNSISLDAGIMVDEYIYRLISSKLYTGLHTIFQNKDIIELLEKQYSNNTKKTTINVETKKKDIIDIIYLSSLSNLAYQGLYIVPTFKLSDGIKFADQDYTHYDLIMTTTDLTNCPTGSYHNWKSQDTKFVCKICGENSENVSRKKDRTDELFYYSLTNIANKICQDCKVRNTNDNDLECKICKKKQDGNYTHDDLVDLDTSLNKKMRAEGEKNEIKMKKKKESSHQKKILTEKVITDLENKYNDSYKNTNNIIYSVVDNFITMLESALGEESNLDLRKYPTYLRYDVYIINHTYDGTILETPIIISQKDKRVVLKDYQSHYNMSVFYYTDHKKQIDIFYNAMTLELIGYKEKHSDYVDLVNSKLYLEISVSVMNMISILGYNARYIDINNYIANKSEQVKDYQNILDAIIRNRVFKLKCIIDKIRLILLKIKNFYPDDNKNNEETVITDNTEIINQLILKYEKLITSLKTDNFMSEWKFLRNKLNYKKNNFIKNDIELKNFFEKNLNKTNFNFINYELINNYDTLGGLILYYFISEITAIINNNSSVSRITTIQMYIEIISYVYNIYNNEMNINSLELKRFSYVLNKSRLSVDIMSKTTENVDINILEEEENAEMDEALGNKPLSKDETEELVEEANALDFENYSDIYEEVDDEYGAAAD